MRAAQIRQWLVEALDSMCDDQPMPFFPQCDLCGRTDTEGYLDSSNLNRAHYENCCDGDRVVGGTLFSTNSGRVICADCVVALGQRGKQAQYGVTLATLVLAGASLPSFLAFWKGSIPPSDLPDTCRFSCQEMDDTGVCPSCYLLYLTRLFPYARAVGCDGQEPHNWSMPCPVPKTSPISLQAMTRMALSTSDMNVAKQFQLSALS